MTAAEAPVPGWVAWSVFGVIVVVLTVVVGYDWFTARRSFRRVGGSPVAGGVVGGSTIDSGRWPSFYDWAKDSFPTRPVMLAEFGLDRPMRSELAVSADLMRCPAGSAELLAAVRYVDVLHSGPVTDDTIRESAEAWDRLVEVCGSFERAAAVEMQVRGLDRHTVGVGR